MGTLSDLHELNACKAIYSNDLADLKAILAKIKENQDQFINKKLTTDKYTLLFFATKLNHVEIIEYLCSLKGCDVNFTVGWNGTTALMKASERGYLEAVKILVSIWHCF